MNPLASPIERPLPDRPSIALIGGAGPLACARLQWELLSRFQKATGARQDSEFPTVVSLNQPVEGIGPLGVEHPTQVLGSLRHLASQAQVLGARAVLVPCASVHACLEDVSLPVPLLDWVDHAAGCWARTGVSRVGVMGSRSARDQGLFGRRLARQGIESLEASDEIQAVVDALIEEGMGGSFSPASRASLEACHQWFRGRGAQGIWWGCTDLAFLPASWAAGVQVLRPMDAMVATVMEHWGVACLPELAVPIQATALSPLIDLSQSDTNTGKPTPVALS